MAGTGQDTLSQNATCVQYDRQLNRKYQEQVLHFINVWAHPDLIFLWTGASIRLAQLSSSTAAADTVHCDIST